MAYHCAQNIVSVELSQGVKLVRETIMLADMSDTSPSGEVGLQADIEWVLVDSHLQEAGSDIRESEGKVNKLLKECVVFLTVYFHWVHNEDSS